jgi:TonB family protein
VEQRVEGKVKLSAIIRKDGRVDMVRVLNPVDQRLDQSAIDALRKWEFEPASRSGQPVEVDVLVEIPFRLAPLDSR